MQYSSLISPDQDFEYIGYDYKCQLIEIGIANKVFPFAATFYEKYKSEPAAVLINNLYFKYEDFIRIYENSMKIFDKIEKKIYDLLDNYRFTLTHCDLNVQLLSFYLITFLNTFDKKTMQLLKFLVNDIYLKEIATSCDCLKYLLLGINKIFLAPPFEKPNIEMLQTLSTLSKNGIAYFPKLYNWSYIDMVQSSMSQLMYICEPFIILTDDMIKSIKGRDKSYFIFQILYCFYVLHNGVEISDLEYEIVMIKSRDRSYGDNLYITSSNSNSKFVIQNDEFVYSLFLKSFRKGLKGVNSDYVKLSKKLGVKINGESLNEYGKSFLAKSLNNTRYINVVDFTKGLHVFY